PTGRRQHARPNPATKELQRRQIAAPAVDDGGAECGPPERVLESDGDAPEGDGANRQATDGESEADGEPAQSGQRPAPDPTDGDHSAGHASNRDAADRDVPDRDDPLRHARSPRHRIDGEADMYHGQTAEAGARTVLVAEDIALLQTRTAYHPRRIE